MNFFTAGGIIYALQHSSYLVMLLLMIVEGPAVSYLASFVASLGLLNIYIVVALTWLGNIIGDLIFYSIGKTWKPKRIKEYLAKKHVKNNFLVKIERGFKNKTGRTLMLVKLIPPHPAPGLISAGFFDVPFPEFLFFSIITTIPQTFIFSALGYFTGSSYNLFINYFHKIGLAIIITSIIIIISIISIYLIRRGIKKYGEKI